MKNRIIALATAFLIMSSSVVSATSIEGLRENKTDINKMMKMSKYVGSDRSATTSSDRVSGWTNYKVKVAVSAENNFNWSILKDSKLKLKLKYIYDGVLKDATGSAATSWEITSSSLSTNREVDISLPKDLTDLNSVNLVADFEDPYDINYDPDVPVIVEESTGISENNEIVKTIKLINTPVTKMNIKYTGLYGNELTDNEIRKNIPSDLYIRFIQDGTDNIKLPLKQGNYAPIKENDNKFVLDKYGAKDDENLKLSLGFLRNGSINSARLNSVETDVDGKGFMLKTDLSKSVKNLTQNGYINLEIAAVPEIAEVPLDGDNPKAKPSFDYVRLTFDANGKTQDKTETTVGGKFSNEEYKGKTKLYLDIKKNTEWRKVKNFLETYSVVGDKGEEFANWKLADSNLNICVMPSENEEEGEQAIPNCKTDSFNDKDTINEDKSFYALYKYKDDIIEKEDGVDPGEGYGLLNLDPNGGVFVRNEKEETGIHSFYIKKNKETTIDEILKKFSLSLKKGDEKSSGWFTKAVNPLATDKISEVTLTDTDKNKTLYASYTQNTLTAQDITVYKGETIDWKRGVKDLPSNVEKVEEVIDAGKTATNSNTVGEFITKLKVTFKDGSSIVVDKVKLIVKSKDITISFDGVNANDDANAPRHSDENVKGKVTTTDTKVTLTDSEVVIKDSNNNVIGITKVKADGTFSAGTSRPLKAGENIKIEVKLPGAESASIPVEKQVKLNPDKLNEILPTAEKVLKNFKDKPGVDKTKYQALVDAVNGNTKNNITGGYQLVDKAGQNENQSDKKPKSTVTVDEKGQKSLDEAYAKIKKAIEDLTANSLPVFEGSTDVTIYKTEELNLDNLVKVTDKDNDIVKQNEKDFSYKVYKIEKTNETEVTDTSNLNETVGDYKIVYMAKDKSAEVNYTVKLHIKDTFVKEIKVTDPTKMEYPITTGDSVNFEIAGMKVELIDNLGNTKESIEPNDFTTKGITLQIENRSSDTTEKTKTLANETALKVEDDVQKIIVTYTQGTGNEQQIFTSETAKILRVFPDKDGDGKDDRKADFDSTKIEKLEVITQPQLEYVAKDAKDTDKLKLNLDGMVIQLTDKAGKNKLVIFKKNSDNNGGKFYEYDSNNQTVEFTGLTLSKNHGTLLTPQTSKSEKGDSGSKVKISVSGATNKYTETKELKVFYDANGDGVPDYEDNQQTLQPNVKSVSNVKENNSVVTKVIGKAQPGAAITVKSSDGNTTLGTGNADANGDFSFNIQKQNAGVEVKVSAKLGTLKESDPVTKEVIDDLDGDGKADVKAKPNKPVISEIREKDKNITVKAPAASEEIKKIVVSDGKNTVTLIKDTTDNSGKTWKVEGSNPEVKVTEGNDGNLVIPVENKLPLNDRDEITVTFKYGENLENEVSDKKAVLKSSPKPTVDPVYTGEENIKVLDPTLSDPNTKTINVVVNNNNPIIVENKNGSWSVKDKPNAGVEVKNGKIIIPLDQAANKDDVIKVTTINDSNKESAQAEVKVVDRTQTTKPTISEAKKDTNSVSGTAEKGSTVTITITKRDNTTKTYQGTVGEDGQFNVTTDVLNDGDKIIVTASIEGKADNTSDETIIGVDTTELGSSIEKAKTIAGDKNQNLDKDKPIDKALIDALVKGKETKEKGDNKDANTTQENVDKAKEELDKAIAQKEADKAVDIAKEKVLDTTATDDDKNNAIKEAQEKIDQVPGSIKEDDTDYNSIKKDLQDKLDLIKAIKDGEDRLKEDDITGNNNKTKKPNDLIKALEDKVKEGKEALNNNSDDVKKEEKTKDIRDALDKINEERILVFIEDVYSGSNAINIKTYPARAHVVVKVNDKQVEQGYTDDYGNIRIVLQNQTFTTDDEIVVEADYNNMKGYNQYTVSM